MMRAMAYTRRLLYRQRHRQRVWNPQAGSRGAAPSTGLSAAEALQIAYRPLPLPQSVEYEEDFGSGMMIHREYISKRNRETMDFQLSALAYSDVELSRGRRYLAGVMNRERRGATVGSGGLPGDRVELDVNSSIESEAHSARYLFNQSRMNYCERFQRFFTDAKTNFSDTLAPRLESPLFSLMEACAILFGCDTREAQEAYFQMFLGLDCDRLDEEKQPHASASSLPAAAPPSPSVLTSLPSIFDPIEPTEAKHSSLSTAAPSNPAVPYSKAPPAEMEPLYDSYAAHVEGKTRMASYDVTSGLTKDALKEERARWRSLMEKLVCEDFLSLTPEDYGDALILNRQLHSVKFLDLNVGDVAQSLVAASQRAEGGTSLDNPSPASGTAALHDP